MLRTLAIALAISGPALADTTAIYEAPNKTFRMTVEVAANGDIRAEVADKPWTYMLTLNGQCYAVISTPKGYVVDRIEDLAAVVRQVTDERMPDDVKKLRDSLGTITIPDQPYFSKGEESVVVQGRKGKPYYFARTAPGAAHSPVLVMSDDPDLAPLGTAMARQAEISDALQPTELRSNSYSRQFEAIMKTGAPLLASNAELTSVSHAPIDPSRFKLPGPMESHADMLTRVRSMATDALVKGF